MFKQLTLLLLACVAFCNTAMAQCQLNYTVSPNPVEFNCTLGSQPIFAQGDTAIHYNWYASNGQTMINSPVFVLTDPATVTVIARHSVTGCTDSTVVQSFVQTSLGVFVESDTISCGNPTGMLTAIPTGTGANATYVWNTGQTGQSIPVTQLGVYTVTVTSGACSAVGQGVVSFIGNSFSISGNTQEPLCGQSNGSIFVTSNGQGVSYQWSNGMVGPTIGNLAAGQYCVVGTDINGCTSSACFFLQGINNISIDSVSITQPGCTGGWGSIWINTVSGTAPFTYIWSNGQTTNGITGLSPNVYSVTVTDATGCSRFYEWQIGGQNNIFVQWSAMQLASCGASDGSITAQAFGGTAPYTYLWNNGVQGATNQGLAQGIYFVTAADATGCTGTSAFTLSSNDSLSLSIATTNASCTSNLGSLTVTATGSNLTYLWSNAATTATIQAVAGIYTVTVTSNGACTRILTGTIGVSSNNLIYGMFIPDGVGQTYVSDIVVTGNAGATISNTNPLAAVWANMEHSYMGDLGIKLTCPNGTTVSLKTYGTGGAGRWIGTPCDVDTSPNTPGIGASLVFTAIATNTMVNAPTVNTVDVCTGTTGQSLPSGNYLPDSPLSGFNGCPIDGLWTIAFTDNLAADNGFLFDWGLQLPGACSNTNNFGSALLGGSSPLTYMWSNGQTTETLQNVPTGIYTVTITDGCSTTTASMSIPSSALSFNITPAACTPNATNGAVTVVYSGTTTPTIAWSNGQTGAIATGLATGWYSVTITNNGCVTQRNIFVPASTVCVATITGFVLNDNGNCVRDAADVAVSNVMIRCTNTVTGAVKYDFTDAQGFYQFTVDTGRYVVNYYTQACDGYTLTCPSSGNINVHAALPNTIYPNNNFFRTATSGTHSLSTYVYRSTARPGFGQTFTIHYTNNNSAPVNATLVFTHDPLLNGFTVTSGATPVYNSATRTATWTLNLAANASGSVSISCNMSQTVSVGVACSGSVSLTANGTDVCPNDNTETWTSITTNSFDPNDKQIFVRQNAAQQVSYGDHAGKDLLYQIRFQNTGTDTAYTVVIRDTLDANILDISTLKLAGASHNCTMEWEGSNILKFHFYNINLPHNAINAVGSNGHAVFTVRTKTGTAASNQVVLRNRAAIYFDYNAPIITNRVVTTLMPPLSVDGKIGEELVVRLFPNPTDANATLTYNLVEQTTLAIVLLDINGRTLRTVQAKTMQQAGEQQVNIEVGDLAAGVYLVQFQTDKGVQTHKLVRQ
jgi:uncharacterized repeat protein (TIGR01451 family)